MNKKIFDDRMKEYITNMWGRDLSSEYIHKDINAFLNKLNEWDFIDDDEYCGYKAYNDLIMKEFRDDCIIETVKGDTTLKELTHKYKCLKTVSGQKKFVDKVLTNIGG